MKKRITLLLRILTTIGMSTYAQNKVIVSEGWDTQSAQEIWTDNDVTWTIDWVEEFSDGSKERYTFTASDRRKLTVLTDWAVLGGYVYQVLTETPEVELVSSTEKTKENAAGVRFKWVREKRKITTRASCKRIIIDEPFPKPIPTEELANEWETVDPFGCVVSYKGKSYTFERKEINVSHSILSSNNQGVYNEYTNINDQLTYTVGDNYITAVAFGVFRCEPSFFPTEWGILYEVKQTVANNETHDSYVYLWSLHFSEGYVLPVVIAPGSRKPDWHFEYCEKTDETAYNSAYFHKGTHSWRNAIASDGDGGMYWTRGGSIVDFKSYELAHECNWDDGHGTSVFTNRYEITLPKLGVIKATDSYSLKLMGSWGGLSAIDQHLKIKMGLYNDTEGGKIIYDGQEINSLKSREFSLESEGPIPVSIQIVPDEGYVLRSVTRDGIDATHYVVDNVLSFSSLSYNTDLRFEFEQGESTPPDDNPEDKDPEAYTVYENGTLTFYYDKLRSERQGQTYDLNEGDNVPGWSAQCEGITRAVFDNSFIYARPTTTYAWFKGCKNLTEIQRWFNLKSSEVTNMARMFENCESLESLDLEYFDTKHVTNMRAMFAGCESIKAFDVSKFNTAQVQDMQQMFMGCSRITTIDVSNFDTQSIQTVQNMFTGCSNLSELVMGSTFVTYEETVCAPVFGNCPLLKTVIFTGDIPASINSNFFSGVGSPDDLARLVFPLAYKNHYWEKFVGYLFYGGYFYRPQDVDQSYTWQLYYYDITAEGNGEVVIDAFRQDIDLGGGYAIIFNFPGMTIREEQKVFLLDHWPGTGVDIKIIPDNNNKVKQVLYKPLRDGETIDVTNELVASGKGGFTYHVDDNGSYPLFVVTFEEKDGDEPDEPQLAATFTVEDAIDGVLIANGIMKTSVIYTNNGSEVVKFYPVIYRSKLEDGEWSGRSNIYSGGSWTLNSGETYKTGTYGNVTDGRYKLEYGYRNADYTKEYILGSMEVEAKYYPMELKGDLTGDDEVNGMDLVALVNMIMGQQTQSAGADINGDGEVNGMDYVALVNIIMAAHSDDVTEARNAEMASSNIIGIEPFNICAGQSREMVITLKNPGMTVTMVQMDMTLPKGLRLSGGYELEHTTPQVHQLYMGGSEQKRRLLLASMQNGVLAGSEGGIIHLTVTADNSFEGGDIVLSNVLCASPELQLARQLQYVLHLNSTTGISNLEPSMLNVQRYFNLSGQRLKAPHKGVNIINRQKIINK